MGRRTLDDEDSLEALAAGELDFDQLMSQSGVSRLGGPQKKASKPKVASPAPQAKAKAEAPARPRPRSGAEERAQAYEERAGELERSLGAESEARRSADARVLELEAENAALRARLGEAERRLGVASARLDEQRDRPSVRELLEARGLAGLDSRGAAIRALVDARRWEELAELLDVIDEPAARAVLSAHLVLHCGRADCPPPDHIARVPVAERRCELCAGKGQAGLMRDISDTLMLAGINRLGLTGGPPAQVRLLADGLDRRLELLRGAAAQEAQLQVAWNVEGEGIRVDGGLAALAEALRSWSAEL